MSNTINDKQPTEQSKTKRHSGRVDELLDFHYPGIQTDLNDIIYKLEKRVKYPEDYIDAAVKDARHDLVVFKSVGITRKI